MVWLIFFFREDTKCIEKIKGTKLIHQGWVHANRNRVISVDPQSYVKATHNPTAHARAHTCTSSLMCSSSIDSHGRAPSKVFLWWLPKHPSCYEHSAIDALAERLQRLQLVLVPPVWEGLSDVWWPAGSTDPDQHIVPNFLREGAVDEQVLRGSQVWSQNKHTVWWSRAWQASCTAVPYLCMQASQNRN